MRSHSQRPPRGLLTPRFEERLADEARFIKTWFDNPILTGAVSPSGRFLARTMARAVDPSGTGPIIELGPGTGPITQAMLSRGVEASRLVLVEFDAAFCRLLRKRFPGVQVVQADAYNLRESLASVLTAPAAAVVSSLPLLTKPEGQRLALLEDAFALMAPGGSFVQFTYGMTSPIPRRAAVDFEAEVSAPVWFNLPPARVWVYRRTGAQARTLELAPDVHAREPQMTLARTSDGFRPVRDQRGSLFHRVAARAKRQLPRRLP
ncbi:MAG: methyltransferase domain-containing protein [Beijerinckiaceae bacterium]